jgi:hypothetical protein
MPRMFIWLIFTIFLFSASLFAQATHPGSIFAVSLYKAHLLSLGGWGGYWLDRALFPYARPHEYLLPDEMSLDLADTEKIANAEALDFLEVSSTAYPAAMMRRALIVVGCLICVGLGA